MKQNSINQYLFNSKKKNLKSINQNGYCYYKFNKENKIIQNKLRKNIYLFFSQIIFQDNSKRGIKSVDVAIAKLSPKKFYEVCIKVRQEINKLLSNKNEEVPFKNYMLSFVKNFCKKSDLNIKDYYLQSGLSVIFSRSFKKNKKLDPEAEVLDFHRENFYNDSKTIDYQLNVWIPIFNISSKQNFKYVPFSHKINDDKIIIKRKNNKFIKKNSSAHKLGLNYAPKKIISGVEFSKAKRFKVPKESFLVLSSRLIHGGGINNSSKPRFALAFGIVSQDKVKKYGNMYANRVKGPLWYKPKLD